MSWFRGGVIIMKSGSSRVIWDSKAALLNNLTFTRHWKNLTAKCKNLTTTQKNLTEFDKILNRPECRRENCCSKILSRACQILSNFTSSKPKFSNFRQMKVTSIWAPRLLFQQPGSSTSVSGNSVKRSACDVKSGMLRVSGYFAILLAIQIGR